MVPEYYVVRSADGSRVPITIQPALRQEIEQSRKGWQSYLGSSYLQSKNAGIYAAKTQDGELIAFGVYSPHASGLAMFIIYIESHPESNPTLTAQRKYFGIGRALVAFGIQLSIDADLGGTVIFEAKTDALYEHYIRDFGAVPIAREVSGGAPVLMIADEAAKELFVSYLV